MHIPLHPQSKVCICNIQPGKQGKIFIDSTKYLLHIVKIALPMVQMRMYFLCTLWLTPLWFVEEVVLTKNCVKQVEWNQLEKIFLENPH